MLGARSLSSRPSDGYVRVGWVTLGGWSDFLTILIQRLTRSLPGGQRDSILSSYISNDLLGCGQGEGLGDHTSSILALTKSTNSAVREQIARLFNTFSSLARGRSYLSEAPPITRGLLEMLYEEGGEDTVTRRNALGAIQKLSLR